MNLKAQGSANIHWLLVLSNLNLDAGSGQWLTKWLNQVQLDQLMLAECPWFSGLSSDATTQVDVF